MMDNDKKINKRNDDIEMTVAVPIGDELADAALQNDTDAVAGEGLADDADKKADKDGGIKELKEAIQQQAREDEQPQSASFTLRKVLGGDILNARLIRSQIWLMVLIVFFVVCYISLRYYAQKDLLEIDRLNTQLKDAKYKALSSSSMLTEKCRESHVLELLRQNSDSTLKMPGHPPFIIQVPR